MYSGSYENGTLTLKLLSRAVSQSRETPRLFFLGREGENWAKKIPPIRTRAT